MKIFRFDDNRVGVVRGDHVHDINHAGDALVPAVPANLEDSRRSRCRPRACFRRFAPRARSSPRR